MIRQLCPERPNWKKHADLAGQKFYHVDGHESWIEGAYYEFSRQQLEEHIIPAAQEVENMSYVALDHMVHDDVFLDGIFIPDALKDYFRKSWLNRDASILGRMDFAYNGVNPPKLLEYNADTPAILYETAFFQSRWFDDAKRLSLIPPKADQFNLVQDLLINALKKSVPENELLHITCCEGSVEDRGTVAYFENCARHAGYKTKFFYSENWSADSQGILYDGDGQKIKYLHKLYPWEWLLEDQEVIAALDRMDTVFLEPAWKYLISNKFLLTYLWYLFEGHGNLLPAYIEEDPLSKTLLNHCVRKPALSREGKNIEIIINGEVQESTSGPYTDSGYIIQERFPLPAFGEQVPIISVWIIQGQPAGLGIIEQTGSTIVQNSARFIPHIII